MQKKIVKAFHWIWQAGISIRLGIHILFAVHFKSHFFLHMKILQVLRFQTDTKMPRKYSKAHELFNRKKYVKMIFSHRGIIRFNNSIWDFWWRHNGKSIHYSVWVLFTNFWNEQSSHPTSGSAAQRMSQLKAFDYSIYIRTESS